MKNEEKSSNIPNLRFPEFNDCYKKIILQDEIVSIGGGTPNTKNSSYWNGTIPWISSSSLVDNNLYKINISKYISEEAIKKSNTKICPAETIHIVNRVGLGKIAISKTELCTSQDFLNIINFTGNNYYLAYLLQKKINNLNSQGTSIKGISSKVIKSLNLFIPSSEVEQSKIAKFLSLIDKRIETQNKIIGALNSYEI